MTEAQRLKNMSVPTGKIDVVLDTDAYNEVDDQFAIAYLLRSTERANAKAIYAAPFLNARSTSPQDGMEKSYREILKLLELMNETVDVFRGAESFLQNENEPVVSPAAIDLAKRVKDYSPENPLYVVAIGAITNVASAMLLEPLVAENTVVVWLGGHAHHYTDTKEFNMAEDVAAARIVMGSGVPFVQLPCEGVVSAFTVSKPDLEYWLLDKNPLADYLSRSVIEEVERYITGKPWRRVIWDVTAVAWLLNDRDRFMRARLVPPVLPTYDNYYASVPDGHLMQYVYKINCGALLEDLFQKILR